jgi:hypothetical protein
MLCHFPVRSNVGCFPNCSKPFYRFFYTKQSQLMTRSNVNSLIRASLNTTGLNTKLSPSILYLLTYIFKTVYAISTVSSYISMICQQPATFSMLLIFHIKKRLSNLHEVGKKIKFFPHKLTITLVLESAH